MDKTQINKPTGRQHSCLIVSDKLFIRFYSNFKRYNLDIFKGSSSQGFCVLIIRDASDTATDIYNGHTWADRPGANQMAVLGIAGLKKS